MDGYRRLVSALRLQAEGKPGPLDTIIIGKHMPDKRPQYLTDCTFTIRWSAEDDEWVGTCKEFPSLSYLAPTAGGAADGIFEVVDATLQELSLVHARSRKETDGP